MAAHSCPALPVPAVTEIGRAEIGPTRIAVYFAVSERAPGRILNDLDAAGLRAVLPGLRWEQISPPSSTGATRSTATTSTTRPGSSTGGADTRSGNP